MNDKETEYLNTLFTGFSAEADGVEDDVPMVDVPAELTGKLFAISEAGYKQTAPKIGFFNSWAKMASVAASLLVAVVLFQVYQQQQTLKQLEQAQADLATALHYLGQANKITRAQVINSLNTNIKNTTAAPVMELGRDAVLPTLKSLGADLNDPNQSL